MRRSITPPPLLGPPSFAAFTALAALTAIAGCGSQEEVDAAPSRAPVVYTTFYPTTYFVERIAGDHVDVVCPVPPGEDPIFWKPAREVLGEYQRADLIVVNGAGFEKWVAQASLPQSRVVDTTAQLSDSFIHYDTTTHSHGPAGEHTHEGVDGHTWLDPLTAKLQAGTITVALAERWPEHATAFAENRAALDADLDALDARLRALTPQVKAVRVLCSHPAYNYLARRYGWEVTSLDLDPEAALDDEQLARIAAAAGDGGARLLLWEGEPAPESAAVLRERLGVTSVTFSPAELPDPDELAAGADYLSVMEGNLDRLEAALEARDG